MAAGQGWQEFLATHPHGTSSDQTSFWDQFLTENPDVLHRLLADVYRATYGADRPPTLDELWDLVGSPRFSSDPFGVAVRKALNGRSIRWLARQIGLHQSAVNRLISGEKSIINIHDPQDSMRRIEAIARALRVHPSYFAEWRRLWVMALIDSAFTANPSLSVGVYQRFAGLASSRQNGR